MESSPVVLPPYVGGPLRLHPFRGWTLTPSRVGDPATTRAIARRSRGAAGRWKQWHERGVLSVDAAPAVYLHEYTAAGVTIRGLVGALDVSHRAVSPVDRAVLPHEGIHPAQADDLADRMEMLRVNPAPILLVHRAPARLREALTELRGRSPDRAFSDYADQRHRVWAVRDPGLLATIDGELLDARALIADGHHRYAAYLRLQQRHPGGAADRGLAMLVDQDDTPLHLSAIHRVLEGATLEDLLAAVKAAGVEARPLPRAEALAVLGPRSMVLTDGADWSVVSVEVPARRALVEALHDDLVPLLARGPTRITYHHSLDQVMERAHHGGVAVLLPALSVDLVMDIVDDDRLLPEKATSFQPKPSLGVLIRSLRDG